MQAYTLMHDTCHRHHKCNSNRCENNLTITNLTLQSCKFDSYILTCWMTSIDNSIT